MSKLAEINRMIERTIAEEELIHGDGKGTIGRLMRWAFHMGRRHAKEELGAYNRRGEPHPPEEK